MIYICGDSFCVSDPDYGPMWVDLLAKRFPVCNLGQVAATNLLIARQVDQAIDDGATFVIMQATAVTRGQKRVGDRLVPFSYHTASSVTTPFSDYQLHVLKQYWTEFFDLEMAVYENSIIIEHSIQRLADSGIPFRFDQGGFEHPNFGNVKQNYFERHNVYRSAVNLWNFARTRDYRPYYHITNAAIHRQIADYYTREIQSHL